MRQQPLEDQKTVKAELMIGLVSLITIWVSVVSIEYELLMCFGILVNLFFGFAALLALLVVIIRAPEGYEDESGFHLGALAGAALR